VAAGDRKAEYRVEALARGLRILRLFSEAQPALRLNELATLAGVPLPTAFRLASTLEEEGFLERLPDGSLRPGLSVLGLGYAALQSDDLVQTAAPSLRRLADTVGHTANLGVLQGDQVLYVSRVRNDASLVTANVQVGSVLPAIQTSMGKLLLAFLPPGEVDARIGPQAYERGGGPNAVRSASALRRQLATIRRQGWALQDEEVAAGLRSISAPLRDGSGTVTAAVNIAVNASVVSVGELVETMLEPLLAACAEISVRLGAPAAVAP
jgi:IclR family pca regulon transcriptional regulator